MSMSQQDLSQFRGLGEQELESLLRRQSTQPRQFELQLAFGVVIAELQDPNARAHGLSPR
ncbi:MAG: hypothetical protein JXQ29_09815 [Planctomycetes bacterium]|nr:hypothetical protein [Planctomycetota bacterium]